MQDFPTTSTDKRKFVLIPMPPMTSATNLIASTKNVSSSVDVHEEEHDTTFDGSEHPPVVQENLLLRRLTRIRRSSISDDYIVFLGEDYTDSVNDPVTFEEALSVTQNDKWLTAMNDEVESMTHNEVWELTELSAEQNVVGCKWVFKTKKKR